MNCWADYFCFPLPTTTGAINDIPSPPKQTRLCTGGCQEVEKSPLEQYKQPLSTSGLLPPSTPGEAAWGPLSIKALMTFSSSSGCSQKVEGVGGEAWVRSLFGITEPLCLPSPSHLPPVSILENDFKRVGGGERRGGWREVTVPGERSGFHRSEKIQKEHSQERAQR